MSDEWRRKSYYRTRVLIPVDECLESEFGDCLVCLTGGQLNLVRNLLLYAERRSTFVSEYHDQYYLAPTEEEWDDLETLTADLEGNLMDCEQFTRDLQEILDWVRLQATLPGGTFSEDELEAFPYDDSIADEDLDAAGDDSCPLAQLWFEWGYQTITEQVLPATRWGFDYLIPALTAFIATAIGGPVAGMGAWTVAEFIQELMEIFYRGAETNLVNWMDTNKQDIVCILNSALLTGGYTSNIWDLVKDNIITPAEDISYGDKLMINLFMGSWAGSNAQLAFDAETEWSTSNVIEGYCDECEGGWGYQEYQFPPCPNGWELVGPDTHCNHVSGNLKISDGPPSEAYSPLIPLVEGTTDLVITWDAKPNYPLGGTAGTITLMRSDNGGDDWTAGSSAGFPGGDADEWRLWTTPVWPVTMPEGRIYRAKFDNIQHGYYVFCREATFTMTPTEE